MSEEFVVFDTIAATVPISASPPEHDPCATSEARTLYAAVKRVCEEQVVLIGGRAHNVLHAGPGRPDKCTTFTPTDLGGFEALVVLERADEPALRVNFTVKMLGARAPTPTALLVVEYSPTTLLAGNNVAPLAIAHPETGEIPAWPSSHLPTLKRIFRLGFDLLEDLHRQATRSEALLFSPPTRAAIAAGRIALGRCQFAIYLPTRDVARFLQIMTVLHEQTIAHKGGVISLATYLGLRFENIIDPDSHEVVGVMFRKLHGKNTIYSVTFYNKRVRLAQMHQGRTLSQGELETVSSCVRMEFTPQREGLVAICKIAQRWAQTLQRQHQFTRPWIERFLRSSPQPSVQWVEHAIYVLSHRPKWGSFSRWLAPFAPRDVLRLHVTATFSNDKFHELLRVRHRIIDAWRNAEFDASDNWADLLAAEADCSRSSVYHMRKSWLAAFGVDISIPFAFYRDLLIFGPTSLMTPESKSAMLSAIHSRDADGFFEGHSEAADAFNRERRVVVAPTIGARPAPLPYKVAVAPVSPRLALGGNRAAPHRLTRASGASEAEPASPGGASHQAARPSRIRHPN